MLAYVAGSVSTDPQCLRENGMSMCLTGSLPFSNYCVSSLAAGFRFHLYSMCIPLPLEILILDGCANEKPLRLIAHLLRARSIFHVYVCITIGIGGRGGTH